VVAEPDVESIPPDGVTRFSVGSRTFVAVGLAVIAFVVGSDLVRHASRAFTFLAMAALFAMALDPVVRALAARSGLDRSAAVAAVAVMVVTVVVLTVAVVAPMAAREAAAIGDQAPNAVDGLTELPLIGDTLRDRGVPERLESAINRLPEQLGRGEAPIQELFNSVVGGVAAAMAIVGLTVAFLLDGPRLAELVRRAVPTPRRVSFDAATSILYRTVGRYFAGSVLVALIAASSVLIVGLLLEVPLIPLIAVWVSMTNLIPQLGSFLGGAAFVLAGAAAGPTTALLCLVWFVVYQQVENNVIVPLIVGDAVDLSAPATMVAALVGAATAGVPGAIIAIPLFGAGKAIMVDLQRRKGLVPEPRPGPVPITKRVRGWRPKRRAA
jgi:predicted PurR-regulated permease PerM